MAVDLTVAALAAALRLGDSAEETAEATRLLGYATTAVETYAPAAPANVQNEAVIRLAGYLFDMPMAARGAAYANAARNSGALRMLLPWRIHRAGSTAEATAAAAAVFGSVANPVIGVTVDQSAGTLTVTFADGSTETDDLPGGMASDAGVDQTARNAAAAASTAAAAAQATANTKDDAWAWARIGSNTLIPPEALFGPNHPNNRTVVVSSEGNFQLIEGGSQAPGDLGTWSFALTDGDVDLYRDTGVDLPEDKTWLFVSPGSHTELGPEADAVATRYGPGPWARVLIADLLTLPAVGNGTALTAENGIPDAGEIQNFRPFWFGANGAGRIFGALDHKNATTTLTGTVRFWVE